MNRINKKLNQNHKLLSIYFTAGYPHLDDTIPILKSLEKSGVDMVEIGLPFSDPLADGETIQFSSNIALQNGMTTEYLLNQLREIRKEISIPLIIMGYYNPILQFGVEKFLQKCHEIGIDGLIIPDLPIDIYVKNYRELFEKNGIINIFLITPQTAVDRIRFIDSVSNGFIYMVSTASVTGNQNSFSENQKNYFQKMAQLKLKNPLITGFGIYDKKTFDDATASTMGAIVGSAFIKNLKENGVEGIEKFIEKFI